MSRRCLLVLSALLLFANRANCGGAYQRTKDGRVLVWNNFPRLGEAATWSGARDSNGYATGYGTLVWYKGERRIVTGSNIASSTAGNVSGRYTGRMLKGRFQGSVLNMDAKGQTSHGTFVNGAKTSDSEEGAMPSPGPEPVQHVPKNSSKQQPVPQSAGTPPTKPQLVEHASKSPANGEPLPPAAGPPRVVAMRPIRPPGSSTSSVLSSNPEAIETAVKNRMIVDFKEQTQLVLSHVGRATGNFQVVDQLDSVHELPPDVSESVSSLVTRARDFRAKLGYKTALSECGTETETVDALSALDQAIHSITGYDATEANAKLGDFLKNNPEPTADTQKQLWLYLTSMRELFGRLEKEAETHSQRAAAFASVGKTGDAIREYQEAYRIFPSPATAEKIRQIQRNSLGL